MCFSTPTVLRSYILCVYGQFKRLICKSRDYNDTTLEVSLNDLFQFVRSKFCVGMGIEFQSGVPRVVLEEIEYFYADREVVDLSDVVTNEQISKEIIPERIYSGVTSGFNTFDFEKVGGMNELCTKSGFISDMPTDTILDLTTDIRGDSVAIRNLLINPYTVYESDGNENLDGQDDIFVLKSHRSALTFVASTDEDFTTIVGGGNYADESFNLYFTPARCILRNSKIAFVGYKNYPTDAFRWQYTNKMDSLQPLGTRNTEFSGALIYENANITTGNPSYDDPVYYPERYIVEVFMTEAQVIALKADKYGYIKLSDTKEGWLLSFLGRNDKGICKLELIRKV